MFLGFPSTTNSPVSWLPYKIWPWFLFVRSGNYPEWPKFKDGERRNSSESRLGGRKTSH